MVAFAQSCIAAKSTIKELICFSCSQMRSEENEACYDRGKGGIKTLLLSVHSLARKGFAGFCLLCV